MGTTDDRPIPLPICFQLTMLATPRSSRRAKELGSLTEPSTYLTDGRRLFRVVRGFTSAAEDSFALLEDCRTLETHSFTAEELWETGLEIVRPARS
ncbi:MAG TPA: hypothetical protein VFT14_03715 [Solirubrobacterales bacterium]|nr:hypothetical protein [Solirubrobacterales bacterium]